MSERQVRPWDLFNKKMGRVDNETYKKRLEICQTCPELIKTTFQCKKCGCFMKQKNKLADASCPLKKWGVHKIEEVSTNE
jgi:hypothetical protein